jgi:methanethiol S-methyltransferase
MKTFRASYLIAMLIGLIFLVPAFYNHLLWMMGGESLPFILKGRWDIALVNILFFSFFIVLTLYKRHVDWRSKNVYTAFIIALFAEMYGFPLTAYFMANYVGAVNVSYHPSYYLNIDFMGVRFTLPTMMIVGGAITVVGLILVTIGWYQIYKGKGRMVTGGLYKYSRHPQYVGILLVTLGWVIHWPTILTIIMWPIMAAIYYRLAREEESWVRGKNPRAFDEYAKGTPMFI